MKLKNLILTCLFGILIVACKKEKTLKEYMTDSWQTTYLKIEMPTYEKSDSLEIFEEKFDKDPELLAQSKYNDDGTFQSWFTNKNGDKLSKSDGKWSLENDSLFVEFFYGGRNMKVGYHVTKTEEGFMSKSNFDWDNDGSFDDFLIMKTKRIKTD